MSKIYKDYLNKTNNNMQIRSFSIVREKMLEDLYNLYKVFKFANTNYMPDGFSTEDYSKISLTVKEVINNILNASSLAECIDFMSSLEQSIFNPTNNKLIMSTMATDITLRRRFSSSIPKPEYALNILFKDIKSSKKRINMLWKNYYKTLPDKEYMRKPWCDTHSNIDLKVYGYFDYFNSFTRSEKQLLNELTEKYLVDSTQTPRVDTNFDIGFLDYADTFPELDFDSCIKKPFYYVNSHVKKFAPIIIGISEYCLSYEAISFISKYLTDVSVYRKENSEYILIMGLASKNRSDNLDVIHEIISQLLGIKAPNLIYDIFGEDRDDIIFRSAYIEPDYIQSNLLKNKEQINKLVAEQNKLLDGQIIKDARRPLIPFSPGQLGLVLVSGDIDGIIDEGNGYYHVIKGSTYRAPVTTTEENDGVRIRTTTNNVATSVTVMLANGQEIVLR